MAAAIQPPSPLSRKDSAAPVGSEASDGVGHELSLPPPRPRACAVCARLKIKCHWPLAGEDGSETSSCVRCTRLRVRCHIPDKVRRKKKTRSTRVSQLEEKIDGIVSLLTSNTPSHPPNPALSASPVTALAPSLSTLLRAAPLPPPPPDSDAAQPTPASVPAADSPSSATSSSSLPGVADHVSPPASRHHRSGGQQKHHGQGQGHHHHSPVPASSEPFTLTLYTITLSMLPEEAAAYIQTYQNVLVPWLPIVPLSADLLRPHALYLYSLYLFWAIVTASAPLSSTAQVEFRRWFRTQICERVIITPLSPAHPHHRSSRLSMLQAIFVHVAWCDNHTFVDFQATSMLHLALALIVELRLDRSSLFADRVARDLTRDAWGTLYKPNAPTSLPLAVLSETRSPTERRLVFGFYYFSSVILQRTGHPLPFTPNIMQYGAALAQADEFASDRILIALVRISSLIDPLLSGPLSRDRVVDGSVELTETVLMALANTSRELSTLFDGLDDEVRNMDCVKLYYQSCLARLYEPIIATRPIPTTSLARNDALWQCLVHASALIEMHAALPPLTVAICPITSILLCGPAMITMTRLLLLDLPLPAGNGSSLSRDGAAATAPFDPAMGWDPALARQRFDYPALTRRLIDNFDRADRATRAVAGHRIRAIGTGASAMAEWAEKLSWARRWYMAKVSGNEPDPGSDLAVGSAGSHARFYKQDAQEQEQQQQQQPRQQVQQERQQHQDQRQQQQQQQQLQHQQQHQQQLQEQAQQQPQPQPLTQMRPYPQQFLAPGDPAMGDGGGAFGGSFSLPAGWGGGGGTDGEDGIFWQTLFDEMFGMHQGGMGMYQQTQAQPAPMGMAGEGMGSGPL